MNKRGQNVIEYILLVAMVVIVFVALLASGGRFHRAVGGNLNSIVPAIDNVANSIQFSN